jgi:hypothetical protein
MPKEIINGTPTILINDIIYTGPLLIYIDKLLTITDLVSSDWRLEKDIKRLDKM